MTEQEFIKIDRVTKKFGDFYAVDDISLDIKKGEIFALLGSSGCGKTTLLRMLAGFEYPDNGQILIDGSDISNIPPYIRPVNMMFQSYALFPHMSVKGNVEFGLKQEKLSNADVRKRSQDVIELVGLGGYENRKMHQLSGGQRQRVALARILAKQPKALLLDEPLSALDKKLRERMQLELVALLKELNMTCVIVTHDQEEAMTIASRLAVMTEGTIRQIGSPTEIYETPNSKFVADFIGSANLFEGTVVADEIDYVKIETPSLSKPILVAHGITGNLGQVVQVALRPEKISLICDPVDKEHNCAPGRIDKVQYYGNMTNYYITLETGYEIKCTLPNQVRNPVHEFVESDQIHVSWDDLSCVVMTQ